MLNPNLITAQLGDKTVIVHPLNADQYRRLVAYMQSKNADPVTGDFMLIQFSVKDADGKPVFSSPEEAEQITPEEASTLLPLCVSVNGFGTEDQKKSPSESTPSN